MMTKMMSLLRQGLAHGGAMADTGVPQQKLFK
jgi:hypothetical protein